MIAFKALRSLGVCWILWAVPLSCLSGSTLLYPSIGLRASDVAVIVNVEDPLSVRMGSYYQERRGIPPNQMIRVRFAPGRNILPVKEFEEIQKQIVRLTPDHVQGYVLTWLAPYRVGCMSITSAMSLGFSDDYCAVGCKQTRESPYFNSSSLAPKDDLAFRPAMLLAARDFDQAKQLIDRGISADESWPLGGRVLLMRTPDKARTIREVRWPAVRELLQDALPLEVIDGRAAVNQSEVMFYFTGLAHVPNIETNRYLPGAVADHLTSAGGVLTGSGQMSALRWLEAGLTGSYGAVIEPCNFPEKFPDVPVFLAHYLAGESLLEAYWKSVRMPGQGVFIGEPLARPFGGVRVISGKDSTPVLKAFGGLGWVLKRADYPVGPYQPAIPPLESTIGLFEYELPVEGRHFLLTALEASRSKLRLLTW